MKNPIKLGFETGLSKTHTCLLELDGYVIESNPGPMLWGLIVKDQQTYRQYGQVNKEQKINQHDVAGQLHTELLGPGGAASGTWSLQPRRLPPFQEPVLAAAVVSILCVPSSRPSSDQALPVLVLLPPICLAFSLISPPPTHSLSSHHVQPTSGCG